MSEHPTYDYSGVPDWLKSEPRYVTWKRKPKSNGKVDKVPLSALTGESIDAHNPNNWTDFDTAVAAHQNNPQKHQGIGFVLGDGWGGVDLDDVFVNGSANHPAMRWSKAMITAGAYVEVSQSGLGVKAIGRINTDDPRLADIGTRPEAQVELYLDGRYFALTGQIYSGGAR